MTHKRHAIIILAAGSSTRMGSIKQLLPLEEMTMISNSIYIALQSGIGDVYVVLGSNMNKIKSHIDSLNITVIENVNWEKGIGSSISSGVKFVEEHNYSGLYILLADQVMITSNHLKEMSIHQVETQSEIIKSEYGGDFSGPPSFFGNKYFEELGQLSGDEGAKLIFNKYESETTSFLCPEGRVDLDTIEDYAQFMAN